MNHRTLRHSPIALGLAILLTAVLTLGFWSAPSVASAADRYIQEHSYEQIFGYENVDSDYCISLYDVKMTTLQRDGYVKKDRKNLSALKKQIIKSAKVSVVTYTEHQSTSKATVTDVSGLKKVAKKNLGSYDFGVVDVEYQVTDSNTGDKVNVPGQVILILDEAEEEEQQTDGEEVVDDGEDDIDQGDEGEEISNEEDADKKKEEAAAKKAKEKEKQKKANTGKISKKENGDDERTAAVTDGGNGGGGQGKMAKSDPLGTGLCIAAALAALLFALSILPDVRVIRWFNQKKAMKQGGM